MKQRLLGALGLFLVLFLQFAFVNVLAKQNTTYDNQLKASIDYVYIDQVANSIFFAEGGFDTDYYFGIKGRGKFTLVQAREKCQTLVTMYYFRWLKCRPFGGDFIHFLQTNYAPTEGVGAKERRLNQNWEKNVNFFMTKNLTNWNAVLLYERERNKRSTN